MNSIKKIRLSSRVILSFGATGLLLILITFLLSGKLERDSNGLNDELVQYKNRNQTYLELYSLSFEIESASSEQSLLNKESPAYQSLAEKFSQKLSSAQSQIETDQDQVSIFEEVSSLWQRIQSEKAQEKPAIGRTRQQILDSLRTQYSTIRSKLASGLAGQDDNFFRTHSEKIKDIADLKGNLWYVTYSIIFILAVVGFFWHRSLIGPMRTIIEATRKIAAGEWGTRIAFDSKTEFGALGISFNEMSEVMARLVACLNEVGNPVYSIDKQYTLHFANTASLEFAGVRREDVILKKKCYEVFKLPLCQTQDCPVSRAWKERRTIAGESFASQRNTRVQVLFQAAALEEADGQILRGVEVLTDITQMKKASAEIEAQRRYLSESINFLLEKMTDFAEGDLTIDLDAEAPGDIGKLYGGFKKSIKNIKAIIEELIDAVESTATASAQISSSIEELAAGVSEQSAQANDVAASVEQMTKSVTDNARNAAKVEQAARENGTVAQSGGEVVEKTVLKMKEIAGVVKDSSETVNQLGELSKQISEIVSVIDDIANQTNLLALNAAIEAARAGEEGRGFAVVADEVRKLAERTTQATKQISSMIKNVQASTGEAVKAMRNGIQEVNAGLVLADEAGSSLKNIVGNAHGIVDMISQIAAANEEQSSTSGEISKNVELISMVSSESANGISQIAGAADDLNKLTTNLQTLIAKFKLNSSGNSDESSNSLKGYHLSAKTKNPYGGSSQDHLQEMKDFPKE
jgi:methyl-accepting chemotaxis protein